MNDGRKDDQDKPRLELIPPKALLELGEVLGHGARKYGEDNWRKVENGPSRYYAAALRHLLAWRAGEKLDPESGLSHLAHALACVTFLLNLDSDQTQAALASPEDKPC
jgi:hypothetical protein